MKKTEKAELVLIAIAAIILLIITFYIFSPKKNTPESQPCISSDVLNLKYSACHNSELNSTLVKIRRSQDSYIINQINISFQGKNIILAQVPEKGQEKQYLFDSSNPQTIIARASVENIKICSSLINVEECDNLGINISVSSPANTSINKSGLANLPPFSQSESDFSCVSDWRCSDWEACVNGIQKRRCTDLKSCIIPTETPDFTKLCSGTCEEKWQCTWSPCLGGYVYADCIDSNNCGTEFSKPTNLSCQPKTSSLCSPEIQCSGWSQCNLDYNFVSIAKGTNTFQGTRERICTDSSNCVFPSIEKEPCAIDIDVYVKSSSCGKNVVDFYNKLDNSLVSRMDYSSDKMNVKFFLSEQAANSSSC